jgi:hypothetical protein
VKLEQDKHTLDHGVWDFHYSFDMDLAKEAGCDDAEDGPGWKGPVCINFKKVALSLYAALISLSLSLSLSLALSHTNTPHPSLTPPPLSCFTHNFYNTSPQFSANAFDNWVVTTVRIKNHQHLRDYVLNEAQLMLEDYNKRPDEL